MSKDSAEPASSGESTPAGYQRTTGGKGFRWEPPTPQRLAELLPGYEIESMLGRGGMGAVYKGKQKSLDRTVAIKILPPGLEEEDPSYIDRFKNEAKVMAKFMHPGIVAVHDFGETSEGQLYIVMEYVHGTDVQQMISSQGKLPPDHALAITAHVCDALKYAHEHGVIHRDIKPANILINHEGAVKVADFGLAKAEEAGGHGFTKTGMAMGTPDYVAPEALMPGVQVDGRADLFAIGVMLYQMLTGQVPRGAWQPASVITPEADRRFDQIITKAMQYDRESRYQSSGEIRQDLDAILTAPQMQGSPPGQAAAPQQSQPQKPTGKPPQKRPEAGAAAAKPQVPAKDAAAAPKSKTPLFIGIGAAAALGIGALMMLGGKKNPGKDSETASPTAQTAAAKPTPASSRPTASNTPSPDREKPKPASPSPASAAAASRTSLTPSTEPWQNILKDTEGLTLSGAAKITSEGLLFSPSGVLKAKKPQRDGAVRAVSTLGSQNLSLHARNNDSKNMGSYRLWATQNHMGLCRYETATRQMIVLKEFPLRVPLKIGQSYEMELRVVGHTLTVKYNGEVLGSITDDALDGGYFGVVSVAKPDSEPVVVPALEVLDLDAPAASGSPASPPTSSPSSLASASAPSRDWQPLQWDPRHESDLKSSLKDGWHHFIQESRFVGENQTPEIKQLKARAYRCRARLDAGGSIKFEQSSTFLSNSGLYSVVIRHWTPNVQKTLATVELSPPMTPGKEFWVEMASCGQMIVARFDGKLVGPVHDDSVLPQSVFKIFCQNAWFKDAEYRDLSGMSEAEVLKLFDVDEKGGDTRAALAQEPVKMTEPAKVAEQEKAMEKAEAAEASISILELKVLHEQFVKLTAERVTAPFEADVAKLNTGYIGGIDRKIAEETAAGHLDGVLALEAEKKLIADKQPMPASDDEKTTAVLKGLRGIYRAAYAKVEAARAANLKLLTGPLSTRLQGLESDLTKQNRIADARMAREYREKLADAGTAPIPAIPTPPATARAPGGAPTAPATKYPKGDDRKAAEWVLNMGGKVTVLLNGISSEPSTAAGLPPGKFTLHKAAISSPNQPLNDILPLAGLKELNHLEISNAPALDDSDMEVLTSLPSLTTLILGRGSLTDAVFASLAHLRNLRHLDLPYQHEIRGDSLNLLSKINLITLNLQECRFSKKGYQNLGLFPQLSKLTLQQASISDEDLACLEPLKKLDEIVLGNTGVTVAGLIASKGMPGLTRLGLTILPGLSMEEGRALAAKFPKVSRITQFTSPSRIQLSPQDITALAALPKLSEFYIRELTDEGIPALLKMPNLNFISITYSSITDAGLEALLPLKELQTLEIGNTAGKTDLITDVGLLKLAGMKKLTTIKCPYTKITNAGIAAFKKLRPDITVTK